MLLYFGGHTIRANRMAPQKLNGTIGLHQDKESIEVNLEIFFLFVSVKSELWKFYPRARVLLPWNVGKISLPADVLWGSFVTRSFLPHEPWGRNECVTNEPQSRWARTTITWDHAQFERFSFVSPCPPECYLQSETKIEPDLSLERRMATLNSYFLVRN